MTDALDEMVDRIRALHHEDASGFCEECGTAPWPCPTIRVMIGEWDFTIPEGDLAAAFREQFRLHGVRPGDRLRLTRLVEVRADDGSQAADKNDD